MSTWIWASFLAFAVLLAVITVAIASIPLLSERNFARQKKYEAKIDEEVDRLLRKRDREGLSEDDLKSILDVKIAPYVTSSPLRERYIGEILDAARPRSSNVLAFRDSERGVARLQRSESEWIGGSSLASPHDEPPGFRER